MKTPAIDRLAARGVRFDRAYVQVAMCSPSRVSMLTGWSPERTGVWTNVDPPRPEGAVPLQEHFAAHGAVTASVGKVMHAPANFRWDVREEHPEVAEEEEHDAVAAREGPDGLWQKASGDDLDQPDGRRARRAAALLERYRHRSFFLAVGFVRPHVRWIAPARYFFLYPPEAMAPVPFPADDLADVPAIAVKTRPQPLPGLSLLGREPPRLVPDPALRRQAMAAYQACVSFADAQVGVLTDALDRLDLWKDTVVVLAGDNGFHLGEHGGLLRKDTLFEEALRVPLIVTAPGLVPAGVVARRPVELLDVYPTVVELAGLPPVPGLDGRSLASTAREARSARPRPGGVLPEGPAPRARVLPADADGPVHAVARRQRGALRPAVGIRRRREPRRATRPRRREGAPPSPPRRAGRGHEDPRRALRASRSRRGRPLPAHQASPGALKPLDFAGTLPAHPAAAGSLARAEHRRPRTVAVSFTRRSRSRRVVLGLVLALAALALVPSPEAAAPGYKVVVASANPVAAIDRGELASIFLKNVTRWKDGREIAPVDQSGRSEIRTMFTRDVLDKAGMSRISAVES